MSPGDLARVLCGDGAGGDDDGPGAGCTDNGAQSGGPHAPGAWAGADEQETGCPDGEGRTERGAVPDV